MRVMKYGIWMNVVSYFIGIIFFWTQEMFATFHMYPLMVYISKYFNFKKIHYFKL
jgi:hypothetical protein